MSSPRHQRKKESVSQIGLFSGPKTYLDAYLSLNSDEEIEKAFEEISVRQEALKKMLEAKKVQTAVTKASQMLSRMGF